MYSGGSPVMLAKHPVMRIVNVCALLVEKELITDLQTSRPKYMREKIQIYAKNKRT